MIKNRQRHSHLTGATLVEYILILLLLIFVFIYAGDLLSQKSIEGGNRSTSTAASVVPCVDSSEGLNQSGIGSDPCK